MYSIYSCIVLQAPLAATQAIHMSNIFDAVKYFYKDWVCSPCILFAFHNKLKIETQRTKNI